MRNNDKNISTISFFSKRTKMENGKVISEEGGFYLEKTNYKKRLCYKKQGFEVCILLSKNTFRKLKSLTTGVILERATILPKDDDDVYDYMDDYDRIYGNACDTYSKKKSSYISYKPKEIAPFIYQEFIPS